jgi:peptidoglycan/LPS O-acetylase OafA/YrhL
MYLNHEYMCPWIVRAVLSRLPFAAQLPLFANLMGVVLVVTLSIAVAIVTFCGVEYPFLQIRKTVLGHHTDRPGSLESVPQRHSFGG